MPILTVEIIAFPGEAPDPSLASSIAERAAEVFGSPPGGTWVKVHRIAREDYAENGGVPANLSPVFVSIFKAKLPLPDALQTEATQLAESVAQICNRSRESVHILYLPEGEGRIAFGGRLLQKHQE